MTLALSGWWIFGWVVAAAIIVVAALLLLAAIMLTRAIVGQMESVTEALDGTQANTEALWEVKGTNLVAARIVRGLATARKAVTK